MDSTRAFVSPRAGLPQRTLRAALLAALLAALFAALLTACTPRKTPAPSLLRADPAQVQWLERQSMLGAAPRLTTLVSGTEKGLRASSVDTGTAGQNGDRIDLLLGAADTWLWVHAPSLLTARLRPVWEELASPAQAELMQALGLRGLYVAPTAESGAIWEYNRRPSLHGEDSTSLFFAPHMGTEAQFAALAGLAERQQWQLGAELPPSATGLGPDFFLAARAVREYPGTYMMLEAPETLWAQLSSVDGTWNSAALEAAQVDMLAHKGILPPALARDRLPWATSGGWAVTGEVRGVDGVNRRWLYRYYGTPQRPQLHWDDPSGNARKIFSAAVIRQVGLLQNTVVSLRAEALLGLDAVSDDATPPTLEPAPSALRDLSREIRRYGGWSLQMDNLPPALTEMALRSGVDFTMDTLVLPAASVALRSGDAAPLRAALAQTQDTDQRRMLRTVTGLRGPGMLVSTSSGASSGAKSADQTLLARRHAALMLFSGGLPGLLFLSGQDLAGTLHPAAPQESKIEGQHEQAGGWSLYLTDMEAPATRQGVARAATLYPPVPEQLRTPGSFADMARRMTQARQRHGLARARMLAPAATSHKALAGVWLALPQGGHALILANFSDAPVREKISLPAQVRHGGKALLNMLEMQDGSIPNRISPDTALELAPYQCVWLLVE